MICEFGRIDVYMLETSHKLAQIHAYLSRQLRIRLFDNHQAIMKITYHWVTTEGPAEIGFRHEYYAIWSIWLPNPPVPRWVPRVA